MHLTSPDDLESLNEVSTALGIGLSLVDRDLRMVWHNRHLDGLLEADGAQNDHHCFSSLWERRERCHDCLPTLVFRTGEPREGLRERARPGQTLAAYRVCAVPVRDASNEIAWVLESFVRMSPPDPANRNLLSRASAAAGAAFLVIDARNRIVSFSPTATALFGHQAENVLGQRVDLLVPDHLREEEAAFAAATLAGERVGRTETVRVAADGRHVPVAVSAVPLFDETGDYVGRSVFLEDLSAVHHLHGLLEIQSQLLAHITHEAADTILGVGPDGRITSWNQGAEQTLGYSTGDILGRRLARLSGDEAAEDLTALIEREGMVRGHMMSWRTSRGDSVPMDVTATRLSTRDGEPIGIAIVARDQSSRLRLERQMMRSEKLASMGSLAAGLAHEIGTPLNVISATAEFLMRHSEGESESREELNVIISETERITKLVEELLSISRGRRTEGARARVAETFTRVIGVLRVTLSSRDVRVEADLPADIPDVPLDPDELHQLALNLIVNAVNAVPDGGAVMVTVGLETPEDATEPMVRVEVEDDGPGVPADHHERIFDPFFTTRPEGTGLGLAVCARIVSGCGGDIGVSTSELGGARFVVHLPVADGGRE